MADFCVHERHGGICEKTGTYCNLGACPYEDLQKFSPVRHGKWIDKVEYAVCMECGGRSGTQYDGVEPIPLMTQFCPKCGARMLDDE